MRQRKRLLTQERCLLEIFGRGPCRFEIFGSVLTLVEDIDAPHRSLGRRYVLWLRKERVRQRRDIAVDLVHPKVSTFYTCALI